jgi:hypothetical protein
VGSAFALLVALALGAPAGPINLNLPPPAVPPPPPAWSNFQLQLPKPPSFLPDPRRVASGARGTDENVNPYLGGDRRHSGTGATDRGVRP